jgi:uncharacterized spore protein YtfJ
MSLNRVFDTILEAREKADWRCAFGEPQVVEGKTIIPVAEVGYAFGLGFGSSAGQSEDEEGSAAEEGGGGGGTAWTRPLGAIVVTPEGVYFEEVRDMTKILLFGMGVGAFSVLQFTKTLRALSGRK